MKNTNRSNKRSRLRSQPRPGSPVKPLPKTERGLRFYHLLALAEEGREAAKADLFREFGFRFGEEQP